MTSLFFHTRCRPTAHDPWGMMTDDAIEPSRIRVRLVERNEDGTLRVELPGVGSWDGVTEGTEPGQASSASGLSVEAVSEVRRAIADAKHAGGEASRMAAEVLAAVFSGVGSTESVLAAARLSRSPSIGDAERASLIAAMAAVLALEGAESDQ